MPATIKHGDIFSSVCNRWDGVLVNPVNCKGVMGAGLAKTFKLKFPEMYSQYNYLCLHEKLTMGKPMLIQNYKSLADPKMLLFPTKFHLAYKSSLPFI